MGKGAISRGLWNLAAAYSTGIDGQNDNFPDLDAIIGPEAIGFAKDIRLAIVFDSNAGEGVLGFHFVEVNQLIVILVINRSLITSV